MRISDWSSDVCSSDLIFCVLESHNARNADVEPKSQNFIGEIPAGCEAMDDAFIRSLPHFLRQYLRRISLGVARMHNDRQPAFSRGSYVGAEAAFLLLARSEEHTSELQSLMRISYAVFCLKKKKRKT